ncbi:MAG TPA: hypothetical protein VHE55_00515 [Fimbriimonadaceae bacterium]|nr:hypothetical protein [Fimbriimonadaceae bacterium]
MSSVEAKTAVVIQNNEGGVHVHSDVRPPALLPICFEVQSQPGRRFFADSDWLGYEPTEAVEEKLQAFVRDPRKVCWLILTGPGGAGKSRTARELARRLQHQGWNVWRYDRRRSGANLSEERDRWTGWDWSAPTLLVVDYAAENAAAVGVAVQSLASKASERKHPIRVLMVERAYDPQLPWMQRFDPDHDAWVANAAFEGGSYPLPPLSSDAFVRVMKAAFEKTPLTTARQEWPDAAETRELLAGLFEGHEDDEEDLRPLYAYFAGEALGEKGLEAIRNWDSENLILFVLQREINHWAVIPGIDEGYLNLLVLATLCGGLSDSELESMEPDESLRLPDMDSLSADIYGHLVSFGAEDSDVAFPPLLPDLLGELFVFERLVNRLGLESKSLARNVQDPARAALALAAGQRTDQTRTLLVKGMQDFPAHDTEKLLYADHAALIEYGFFERGLAAFEKGRWWQACSAWAIVTKLNNASFAAFANWGNALAGMAMEKQGEERWTFYERACEKYECATAIKPDFYVAFYNWGNALGGMAKEKQGEERRTFYERACEKYERATAIKPDFYVAFYNWGNALDGMAKEKQGEERRTFNERACEKYERATEIKPDFHEALSNWGIALVMMAMEKQGEERWTLYGRACEKYKLATTINPDDPEAFSNWGNALAMMAKEKQGEERWALYEQACEKYGHATTLKPDLHEAFYNWGIALANKAMEKQGEEWRGLLSKALVLVQRAQSILPSESNYQRLSSVIASDLAEADESA